MVHAALLLLMLWGRSHGPRFTISLKRSTQNLSAIHNNAGPITPSLGQKQTFAVRNVMSALHSIADICTAQAHDRFGPIADITRSPRRLVQSACSVC